MNDGKDSSLLQEKQYAATEDGVQLAMTANEYEEMKKLHSYILEILIDVDKFCRDNHITYYLGEGTLLGAVRHKGFIYWDDDADILMPREDYEKFLSVAPGALGDKYTVDSFQTNPRHWSIPSMVQMKRETRFKKPLFGSVALNNGPNVDIFPLDYVPTDYSKRLYIRSSVIRALKRALWIKSGIHSIKNYKTLKRRVLYYFPCKLISVFGSAASLKKKIQYLLLKTNNKSNGFLANFASLYSIKREVYPKEWYGLPIEIEFEGSRFFAPCEPDKVLKKLYGDYRQLPPFEKRRSKHHFSNFSKQ